MEEEDTGHGGQLGSEPQQDKGKGPSRDSASAVSCMLRSVQCTVIAQMDGSRKSTVGRVAGAEPCGRHSLTKVLETVAQAGEGRQRRGEMCRPKQAVHEGQD